LPLGHLLLRTQVHYDRSPLRRKRPRARREMAEAEASSASRARDAAESKLFEGAQMDLERDSMRERTERSEEDSTRLEETTSNLVTARRARKEPAKLPNLSRVDRSRTFRCSPRYAPGPHG